MDKESQELFDILTEGLLTEAPEEESSEPGEETGNPAEEAGNKEEGSVESTGSESQTTAEGVEENKPFQNLDLRKVVCFGFSTPKDKCWATLTVQSQTVGWNKINVQALEFSLAENVEATYFNIATVSLVDLDDETKYQAAFDNDTGLWKLTIENSPKAEIEEEVKAEFFSSEMFKKVALRVAVYVKRAKKLYDTIIDQHLRLGELLDVDEVKLNREIYLLNQELNIENLETGKWMK